jgi:hypothetical protein
LTEEIRQWLSEMTRQRVEKALSRAKRVDDARLNVLLSREMHRYLKLFSLEREMSIAFPICLVRG